jgi:hypothetical protein
MCRHLLLKIPLGLLAANFLVSAHPTRCLCIFKGRSEVKRGMIAKYYNFKKISQITQPGFSFFQSCCWLLKFCYIFQNFSNFFGKFTLSKPQCKNSPTKFILKKRKKEKQVLKKLNS